MVAHYSSRAAAAISRSSYKVGQPAAASAAATTAPQQRTKGHIYVYTYCTVLQYIVKLKIVVLIKCNAQKHKKKPHFNIKL